MESILDLVNFLIKSHSMWIPCTSPYEFHAPVHMDSMEQSIWILWNSPYGFHALVHMDSMEQSMDSIVKVLILVILVEFEN